MAHIKLENVKLDYPVYGTDNRSLKNDLLKFATGGKLAKNAKGVVIVEALNNINLDLQSGDRLGLIGPNGAGKTTLLKVLAEVYTPTSGTINVLGKTNCLFDIMMGMDVDLTGYENIKLRGILLGLPNKKIKEITPDIELFSGLDGFLSMPVRTYSSGMMLRLAFGIITSISTEILLIDEVVNVGDSNFMLKAKQRMSCLIHESDIMVLSTHDLNTLKEFCNKILWLEHGKIKMIGEPNTVLEQYKASTKQ